MYATLAIGLLGLAVIGQVEAEAEIDAPAASSTDNSVATEESPADAPETSPETAPESDDRPIRPRRGPAPTADRISGVEYTPNPDGTIRRETTVLGEREASQEAESEELGSTGDRAKPPLERAKVGSIHDSPDVDSASPDDVVVEEDAPWNGLWIFAAIAAGLVLIGMVAGFFSRRRAK